MKVKVLKPGLFTSIQDAGRHGYEAYGVPPSGFLDTNAAQLANGLVGNHANAALIEITGVGPKLEFNHPGQIAITGADISPSINGRFIRNNERLVIQEGDILDFGRLKSGYRAYLAIGGEIQVEEVYGSKSTNIQSGFGGFKGRTLYKGDEFEVRNTKVVQNVLDRSSLPSYNSIIRISPGPELHWFTHKELANFMNARFTIATDSNRMGCRLEGNWQSNRKIDTIISSGNVPGVIQVTPALQPIVLLNDAGTTGGYARIGVCYQEGLNSIAQLKPGDTLEFSF